MSDYQIWASKLIEGDAVTGDPELNPNPDSKGPREIQRISLACDSGDIGRFEITKVDLIRLLHSIKWSENKIKQFLRQFASKATFYTK